MAADRRRGRRLVPALAVLGVAALAAVATVARSAPAEARPPASARGLAATAKAGDAVMVRFAPGTARAAIDAAVDAAGGEVIDSGLAAIGAALVKPSRADFRSRIARAPGVEATWQPTLVRYREPDTGAGGGPWIMPFVRGSGFPDPMHDAASFRGETNPRGVLQWDDRATRVNDAWSTTTGDPAVRVAVVDSGVDGSQRELAGVVEASYTMLPCRQMHAMFGAAFDFGRDCVMADGDGHGTWVASRIAGAVNGFASNGIAPGVTILSYKAVSASLGGGATAWIVDAMVHACSWGGADIVNLSLGTYDDPADPDAAQDYLLWVEAVDYCRSHGVAVVASAGNDHVRVDRSDVVVGGRDLRGVGVVSRSAEGYTFARSTEPGDPRPGYLVAPAGIPGVLMVAATGNATAAPGDDVPSSLRPPASAQGRLDQLAYYSNYGSRIDVAAPGGARKFNLPRTDGGPGNILYGGWGVLGAAVADGETCRSDGGLRDFACFNLLDQTLGWFQGSSMAAPAASGIAALALSAHPELRRHPDALTELLRATARAAPGNATPPLAPLDHGLDYAGTACPTGYCHLDWSAGAISDADAYGAGILDAAAAVR